VVPRHITSERSVCNKAYASSRFSSVHLSKRQQSYYEIVIQEKEKVRLRISYNKRELVQSHSFIKNNITVRVEFNIPE
jgi:hypothetical protein